MIRVSTFLLAVSLTIAAECAAEVKTGNPHKLTFWGIASITTRDPDTSESIDASVIDTNLSNIVDVSSSQGKLVLVAADASHDATEGLSLFTYDRAGKVLMRIRQIKGLHAAALAPNDDTFALIVCSSPGCSLQLLDSTSQRSETLVAEGIDRASGLSWDKTGTQLAYGVVGGEIKVKNVSTRADVLSIHGAAPAWSPHGDSLAFRKEKSLRIYDLKTSKERTLVDRWFWQTHLSGRIHWSPDGSRLAVSVPAGVAGYEFKCLVVNAVTGQYDTHESGYRRCGPWL